MVLYSVRSLRQHLLFLLLLLYLHVEQVRQSKVSEVKVYRVILKYDLAFLKGLAVSHTTGRGLYLWKINVKSYQGNLWKTQITSLL